MSKERTTTIRIDMNLWKYIKDRRQIDETMNDTVYRLLGIQVGGTEHEM